MNFLYSIWDNKRQIEPLGIYVQGYALSGRYSGFWIRQWKIMLDAGLQSPFNPEHIFITHTHTDHIERLFQLITAITTRPVIYVPEGAKTYVQNYLDAVEKMVTMCSDEDFTNREQWYNIQEVKGGDVFDIKANGSRLRVNVFATDHCIVSVGYGFSEYRKKLKHEYVMSSAHDLQRLRNEGADMYKTMVSGLLVYTGDTRNSIFENEDKMKWSDYKVILTEATLIKRLSPNIKDFDNFVNIRGHNTLENIERIAPKYPDTTFWLCHFSQRYEKSAIERIEKLGNYKNIRFWI